MSPAFLTRSSSHLNTILVFGSGVLLVTICVALLQFNGFDAVAALRDGALNDKPEAGVISDFGILLMGSSALFAFFRGWVGKNLSTVALGAFCGFFALDDALLIHEKLGNFEIIFFAFYGVFLLFILTIFTRANNGLTVWPIIYTFIAFASSVAVDVLWGPLLELGPFGLGLSDWHLTRIGYCLEDIPKFGGIVLLSSFAIGEGQNAKYLASKDEPAL